MKDNQFKMFLYLVMNKDFRDRVMKPNKERSYFWKKWGGEEPESITEEKQAFEFIDRLKFKKEELSCDEMDEVLGKVLAYEKAAIQEDAAEISYSFFKSNWLMKVAVILLVLLSSVYAHNYFVKDAVSDPAEEWIVVENTEGKPSEITLPDGTIVNLNAKSTLTYPKAFKRNYRKVKLQGEAFFEVTRNESAPFFVETKDIDTEVLGTSFNVKSFADESTTKVSLVEGKVRVNKLKNLMSYESVFLSPGEQITYYKNSEKLVKESFDFEQVLFWKQGIVVFDNADLEEFIRKMEEMFDVNFQIHGSLSKKWQITGRYKCESLENALIGLKFVYDVDYKIDGKNVILNLNKK